MDLSVGAFISIAIQFNSNSFFVLIEILCFQFFSSFFFASKQFVVITLLDSKFFLFDVVLQIYRVSSERRKKKQIRN